MFTRTYEQLLDFYDAIWEKRSIYTQNSRTNDFFQRILILLKAYTKCYGTTHGKTIETIISSYFQNGKILIPLLPRHKNPCVLMQTISLSIPREKVDSKGGLAALFEVVRRRTGIDIFIFYENCNIRKLQQAIKFQDIDTMEDLISDIDVTAEYQFDGIYGEATPLQLVFHYPLKNPDYQADFMLEAVKLLAARNRACINFITIMNFNHLRKSIQNIPINKCNEISEYLETENCVNNIILFICGSKIENFCQLPFIPMDVIHEICLLTIQSTIQESHSTLALIKRLLNEYANEHFMTEQSELARKVSRHINGDSYILRNQVPFFQNPGFILYLLSGAIAPSKPEKSSPERKQQEYKDKLVNGFYQPGFHDDLPIEFRRVLKKIGVLTSIDVEAFNRGTPLTKFYNSHILFILDAYERATKPCLIELILRNKDEFPNAAEDIKLIFAHPYCTTSDRKQMADSFVQYYHQRDDKLNLLNECIHLLASNPEELMELFSRHHLSSELEPMFSNKRDNSVYAGSSTLFSSDTGVQVEEIDCDDEDIITLKNEVSLV